MASILPISVGLAISSAYLAMHLFNDASYGVCGPFVYRPPHCEGAGDGVVVEGFTIPCGKGSDAVFIICIVGIVGFLLPPIIIGVSLFLFTNQSPRS